MILASSGMLADITHTQRCRAFPFHWLRAAALPAQLATNLLSLLHATPVAVALLLFSNAHNESLNTSHIALEFGTRCQHSVARVVEPVSIYPRNSWVNAQ